MAHQHEKWMIAPSAKGGFYCRACGDTIMTKFEVTPRFTVEAKDADEAWEAGDHEVSLMAWEGMGALYEGCDVKPMVD